MRSKMASIWRIFGRGTSSPPPVSEFLHLSNTNIQKINSLTSRSFDDINQSFATSRKLEQAEPLNLHQCRSLSSKLLRTMENITALLYFWDKDSSSATSNASTMALENFYLVSERAKQLVESCCSVDWCQASTFQIQNEEAFKEILLETSLCYNAIYELVKDKVLFQDLRSTSTFEPPTSAEVMHDRIALLHRYQNFVAISTNSDGTPNMQQQHLAKHLLRRLRSITTQSNIEDFDVSDLNLWPGGKGRGDGWGKISEFLGSNVFKTTWLDVPCAKKVFKDGVPEEQILAEARILARLNHPNIVKFICWGHDSENTWCHFIAMEQMERGLDSVIRKQARLNKGAPFPLLSALDIMLQIAYGTCYLHDNGIAHRDLKTSNVVVRQMTTPHLQDYLQVKLIDFGLSKVKLSASKSNTISHPKTGTTVYMAPEAFQHGRANWFKADVYSFGIMCSVILSGEEPFSSVKFHRTEVHEAICNGERPMLPPETPEELACLIKECWNTDRKLRPDFVDICTRLAKLRHNLLREDPYGHGFKSGVDGLIANMRIQDMIRRRSDARKQVCKLLLENVIEEDEWFVPDEEFGIHKQHEEPKILTASHTSKSSSYSEVPDKLRNSASESFVDNESKSSPSSSLRVMLSTPSPAHSGMQVKPITQGENTPSQAQLGELIGMKMQESTPSQVQRGELIQLKLQLVHLLNQNGGKMMLFNVPAEYVKLFGRGLCLDDYNAESLVHLIDKMKDTLFIKGNGIRKILHLENKKLGNMTNKSKPSINGASILKGNNDKDTSEDSESENTVPPSKELGKETTEIDFTANLLSKSSLLEVEKDSEEETYAVRDSLSKRHLLDMDIDLQMDERSLPSDWSPAKVDIKSNIDSSIVENIFDVRKDDIKVEDFVLRDVTRRINLANFKRQLQELLVVYSYKVPLKYFVMAYQQRFGQALDLPSFGAVNLEALFDKVKDVAIIKEGQHYGVHETFVMAIKNVKNVVETDTFC